MRLHTIVAVVLLGIGAWLAIPATNAQQDRGGTSETELRELLTTKHDVLLNRMQLLKANYSLGRASGDDVLLAEELVWHAALELATTNERRLAILKHCIDVRRTIEERTIAEYQNGNVAEDHKLLATAKRIQAEVDYVREEMKQNEPG